MKVVDANVLLYAVNEASEFHTESLEWIDRALSGEDTVGLPWLVMVSFVRLSTHPAVFTNPLTSEQAISRLSDWTASAYARTINPGPKHLQILSELLDRTGTGGNLTNDAHIAALALEHHADVVSFDNDFTRFPGVRWRTPAQLLADTTGSPAATTAAE